MEELTQDKLKSIIREELSEGMSDEAEREEAKRAVEILYQAVDDVRREVSRDNSYIVSVVENHVESAKEEVRRLAEIR